MNPATTAPVDALISEDTPRARPRWRVFWVAWLLLSLLSVSWAMATPIAASPDEPAHIVKAASVARGQLVGERSPAGRVVTVPRYVADTNVRTCFAFHNDQSAACVVVPPGDPGELQLGTTTAGLYNPLYYAIVGWPSLIFQDEAGLYAMRIVSAVATALFLALSLFMLSALPRRGLVYAAFGIATPPMLLFLGGSVNPNALETTTTLAAFSAVLAIVLQKDDEQLRTRAVILAISAAIAVNTRGLSPLWVLVAVLVPLCLIGWKRIVQLLRRPAMLVAIGVTIVATGLALAWTVGTSSLTAPVDYDENFQRYPGVGASFFTGFFNTLRDTFGYGQNMIANFGWLDTPAPILVYFTWAAFTGIVILAAFSLLRGRPLVFASLLSALYVLLPALVQGAYITGGGVIWQGRYALALYAMLIVGLVTMVAVDARGAGSLTVSVDPLRRRPYARMLFIVWLAWSISQVYSFVTAQKRYAVSIDGSWKKFFLDPQWQPPGGNLAWLAVCTVLVAVTAWLAWRESTRRPLVPSQDASA